MVLVLVHNSCLVDLAGQYRPLKIDIYELSIMLNKREAVCMRSRCSSLQPSTRPFGLRVSGIESALRASTLMTESMLVH